MRIPLINIFEYNTAIIRLLKDVNSKSLQTFCSKNFSTEADMSDDFKKNINEMEKQLEVPDLSKSMKIYLRASLAKENFVKQQTEEWEKGRKHLANMMGKSAENFTQEDINVSLKYLLPSGLHDTHAHPQMLHPSEFYKRRKLLLFDSSGRPKHHLFYTGKPAYYSILQIVSNKADALFELGSNATILSEEEYMKSYEDSKWLTKKEMEAAILEELTDNEYDFLIKSFNRVMEHPKGMNEKEFIMKYRTLKIIKQKEVDDVLLYREDGRPYSIGEGHRKTVRATVTVVGGGSGKVVINGEDILYFEYFQDRRQILFPLQLSEMLGRVDFEAKAVCPITKHIMPKLHQSCYAGAIRVALARGLRPFLSETVKERMRIAGLFMDDKRYKERNKPEFKGARAKPRWLRR